MSFLPGFLINQVLDSFPAIWVHLFGIVIFWCLNKRKGWSKIIRTVVVTWFFNYRILHLITELPIPIVIDTLGLYVVNRASLGFYFFPMSKRLNVACLWNMPTVGWMNVLKVFITSQFNLYTDSWYHSVIEESIGS